VSGGYESFRDRSGKVELDCDVVVVGSGSAGAVVATELAESGASVVVLEEGSRITADEHARMRPSESLRHVWRDAGMTVALGVGESPSINVTMGRVVGGSSMVTGGVCFRIPEQVFRDWRVLHGLSGYTEAAFEPIFEHVERRIHVENVPASMQSRSTQLFGVGASRLGHPIEPMRRNTDGCRGLSQCNFGCPAKAKLSVDLSYLPHAVKAGARVYSHALVERIVTRGGRAVGVEGRLLNRENAAPGDALRVRARRVVVACGAFHTPKLLAASGVGKRSRQVGRNMTLHPAFRMLARFDEDVRGWQGSLQSAFTDAFEHEGITLMSVFVPPGVIAATLPGFGPKHLERTREMPHLAMFGGLIHDQGGGRLRHPPRREPFATYRMAKEDRARVPRVVRILGETFLAAGAREVFPPILGVDRGFDADAFRALPLESISPRRYECSSQHPLGSARMGVSADRAVVDPDGRAFDVEELYVVDGSVLPTSLGVNPQLSVMSVATRLAFGMIERRMPS
jgi:choline dehydrogenase-like flavoprotein